MAETMVFLTPTFFLGYSDGDHTNVRITPAPGYRVSLVIPPCDDPDCHCGGRGHVDMVIEAIETKEAKVEEKATEGIGEIIAASEVPS